MNDITAAAGRAAAPYAAWSATRRRDLLHTVADALEARRSDLVPLAVRESGLTTARLEGELTRTTNQLRLLGDFVAAGGHHEHRDSPGGAPDGSDITIAVVPVGPVAVFAASNFPFAFGVPGGDTASALAAGCPVVVKSHPAQPELSRLLVAILGESITAAGAPEGTFGAVEGADNDVSIDLVTAPEITAVGFTGSLRGGRALMDAAAARPDPIPVYAEMGSLNPLFVLPGAAAETDRAAAVAGAVTGSAGQLCTKPGLVIVPDDVTGTAFADALTTAVTVTGAAPMLTPGMLAAHRDWAEEVGKREELTVTSGTADGEAAAPLVIRTGLPSGDLLEEHFGPAVVIAAVPVERYAALAAALPGSLTATLLGTDADATTAAPLAATLARGAGRVIWNGVPTGVGVCDAMQHGGPWPATGAPWSTSVGTASVRRFVRPVALQGLPAALLEAIAR